jgi:hypothetical protein
MCTRMMAGCFDRRTTNWHCERLSAASLADYTCRSWQQAWEYTHTYPRNPAKALYFVLVVSDEETAGMQ